MNSQEAKSVIEEGRQAGLRGDEVWQCPHVNGTSEILATQFWFAGWCRGRQEIAKENAEREKAEREERLRRFRC